MPARLHGGGRPPAGARAHRLPQRLEPGRRQRELPLRPEAPRHRHQDDLPARGTFTWKDSCGSPSRIPITRVLRRGSSGATSSPARRTRDAARARAALRLERARQSARRRRDPQASRSLRGGRLVKSPAVYTAGLLAAPRPADRHDVVVVARRDGRPAALLPAERGRLGRHPLARHGHVARPLVDGAERAAAVRPRPGQGVAAVRRGDAARRRARLLASPRAERRHPAALAPLRAGGTRGRGKRVVEAQAVPVMAQKRCAS